MTRLTRSIAALCHASGALPPGRFWQAAGAGAPDDLISIDAFRAD